MEAATAELARVVPVDTPVICFQNGVASEPLVAATFTNVFGGVCRMTCSMIQPGHASFRSPGRVIIGAYPKGSNAYTRACALAYRQAGFDAVSSRTIMSDKWLKLAVNTQSVVHAAVDARDHDTNEFHEFKASLLDEVRRVLRAARIRARSCDGRDPGIEEMIAELRRPLARRSGHGVKVHNSFWQDLYLKRDRIEAEYFHGPVIALGQEHGIPTPCNAVVLKVARRLHQSGTGPGTIRLSELIDDVARQRSKK